MSAKYDTIGIHYDWYRKADRYLTSHFLNYLQPKKEGLYLDIGCGTGNYTNALQHDGYHFIGIDPSEEMLKKARIKNADITWKIGTSERTGLPENHVDGIVASLTMHHWVSLEHGFKELFRVLKPDGNMVLFTSTPQQMDGYWLNHYFPKMMEQSAAQMPSYEAIKTAAHNAGFRIHRTENYFIKPNLEDKFLYCGKHNPELYFDERIRDGISSFKALANKEEVDAGLMQLKQDINSRKITAIMDSYRNVIGDYKFIICKPSG